MVKSIRARALFFPQQHIERMQGEAKLEISNFIHRTEKLEEKWIEETTEKIGDWKDLSRSIYLRWAITINAMCLAAERYKEFPTDKALRTNTMRSRNGQAEITPIAIWSGAEAATHYESSRELIAAYGVADLVGSIEDILFDCFEIYLRQNPKKFMVGQENKEFRKLYAKRAVNKVAWEESLSKRIETWRRKRAYDALFRVLTDYWKETDLKRPSLYMETNISDWADTLKLFSELRNLIVHSAPAVSENLENFCKIKTNMAFDFKAGEELKIELKHLQAIECFIEQYLVALNISLIEKGTGMDFGKFNNLQ